MAKKSKKAGAFIPLVGAILAIIAIILLAAPGVSSYVSAAGDTVVSDPISGFDFFFDGLRGGLDIPADAGFGPYTGLIVAFVLLVIGALFPILGLVIGTFGAKKGAGALEALGGACAIVGGVMSLLALVIAGISEPTSILGIEAGYRLQWGLWLTGIVSIIGGIVSAVGGAKNALS